MQMLKALWSYREFILGSVKREFQGRYNRSLLGIFWTVIEPLSMILVYTIVFSQIMRARLPGIDDGWSYSIYLCIGIVTWEYFVTVILRSQTMFIEQANLIKKTNFPRSTLPVIVLLNATINFLIIFSLVMVFLLLIGRFPGWVALAMIPLLIIQQGFAIGLGLVCGTLNVFFRDIGKSIGVIIIFWFWLTPIVYPRDTLPEFIQDLLITWNPMAAFIGAYQDIFLTGTMPNWSVFIPHVIEAILLLWLGFFTFMKLSGEMVDEL